MAKKKAVRAGKKGLPAPRSTLALKIRKGVKLGLVAVLVAGLVALVVLDTQLQSRFSGSKWSLPSHVYSRGLELYEGLALSPEDFIWELEQLGYRRVARLSAAGQYRVQGRRIDVYSRAFQFWHEAKTAQAFSLTFDGDGLARLRTQQGGPLSLVRLEPLRIGGIYPAHHEDRLPVRLEELPPLLLESLVTVEDRDFYRHYGVSLRGIGRALGNNLRPGSATQGGSTITQQLVKNLYLSQDRSLLRKGLEAVMALLLEQHFSKGEIIEAYINEIYLGQAGQRAIHGFGMASQHYFRQPLAELDLHQIALLVAMAKGASYYDPRRNGERALARRNLVVDLLESRGLINNIVASRARQQPLGLASKPDNRANPFPAYLDLVKRQLREDYADEDLRNGGLRVFTHFDPQVQRRVEKVMTTKLAALERQKGLSGKQIEAASVVVRVGTAEVLALASGRESAFAGFSRALDIRRPIGSLVKPVVYLTALERPNDFTLLSSMDDGPVAIPTDQGAIWRPQNFDHKSHGEVPLYEAMGQSYNLATARLGMALGLGRISDTLQRLGYEGVIPQVPALTLGAVSMAPFDVATIYHTIATGGFYSPLASIHSVYSSENQPLKRYPYRVENRFDTGAMHLLQYAMQVVMREGTGRSAYHYVEDGIALAGKTGTSNDQRDSWFSGFNDDYLAVVWLGRDDNGKMPFTGSSGALQLWSQLMSDLQAGSLAFTRPDNIVYHWVDPQLGLLSEKACTGARYMPFIVGSEPQEAVTCRPQRGAKILDWLKGLLD